MSDGNGLRPTFEIVVTAIWGLLMLPGLAMAALSPMLFDAPGSMNDPVAWTDALIVVSFPILCVLSIAATWIVWFWRRQRPARPVSYAQIAAACLPLIPIVYVVGAVVVETAGVVLSGQPLGLHSTVIHPVQSGPSTRPHHT